MAKVTSEPRLTAKQIHTLKLLYKFRFLTAGLLRDYRHQKSDVPVTRAFKLLVGKGYVIRRYKKSYRLLGKPGSYSLAPKALTYLRDSLNLDQGILHSYYKNKTVSDEFIEHHVEVLKTYLKLRASHQGLLNIYTKYELSNNDDLPDIKPDLYLQNAAQNSALASQYLLYIYEDSQLFVIKKQLKRIHEFYETEDSVGIGLVVLCKNGSQESALISYLDALQDGYDVDFVSNVTTVKAFSDLSSL